MLENISAAIIVDQQRLGGNLRSTVATVTLGAAKAWPTTTGDR
jgi:excinuclease UvrABC ATPase subunit